MLLVLMVIRGLPVCISKASLSLPSLYVLSGMESKLMPSFSLMSSMTEWKSSVIPSPVLADTM